MGARLHAHTDTHARVHTRTRMHTDAHMKTCTPKYTLAHPAAHAHTCTHICLLRTCVARPFPPAAGEDPARAACVSLSGTDTGLGAARLPPAWRVVSPLSRTPHRPGFGGGVGVSAPRGCGHRRQFTLRRSLVSSFSCGFCGSQRAASAPTLQRGTLRLGRRCPGVRQRPQPRGWKPQPPVGG